MEPINDLPAYLQEETEKLRKNTRRVVAGGAALSLLMLGYLGFVNHMISTFARPENLASLVGMQARASLPELLAKSEQMLADKAPEVADTLSARAVAAIAEVGEEGRRQIDAAITDQLPHLGDEISATLLHYLDAHAKDLRDLANDKDRDAFAKGLAEMLIADLEKELDRMIAEDGHAFSLREAGEALNLHLVAADQRLGELLAKPRSQLTDEEKLQRAALAGFYRHLGKVTAGGK